MLTELLVFIKFASAQHRKKLPGEFTDYDLEQECGILVNVE